MSQRNPMNERYTTDQKHGSTRKSAASAKPVSKAASSVRTAPAKPEKKGLFGGSKKSEPAPKEAPKSAAKSAPKKTAAQASAKKQESAAPLSKEEKREIEKHNKQVKREDREARRERNKEINRFVPDTAEFKRLNRKRMIYSGVGFVGMIIAIILSLVVPQQPFISIGLMIAAWLFFFFGMRIDTNQLRPLREQGYEKALRQAQKKAKKKR